MKSLAAMVMLVASTSALAAEEATNVKVYDHTKIVTQTNPVTERRCNDVQVPIYQQGQGATGGDVLTGMILGGLLGKGATGKDDGAAAGAVIGGIIAADQGNKPKVSGYRLERQCNDVTVYIDQEVEVYSHSTVRFYIDGKRYVVPFQR